MCCCVRQPVLYAVEMLRKEALECLIIGLTTLFAPAALA